MTPVTPDRRPATTAFALPSSLAAKADPALISADDERFRDIAATLAASIAALSERLDDIRLRPAGEGQEALDRDLEAHRLSSRLRTLRRYGIDLCLGRIVSADGSAPLYIGRLGLTDDDGRPLLIDWRAPAAEPFFAATHGDPRGLASRRRYRWTGGRVTDYWDEVFTPEGLTGHAALDDQSAFIASLGTSRSPRMRDVLSTIQADQDAIVRAGSHGALVVDGGPGTGKTVVALHRAAYLLYSEPRLPRDGGVLFVGPSDAYLRYVDDVLPSLGEDAVRLCTLRDLVPEGVAAQPEQDSAAAALKATAGLERAIDAAVGFYERPPEEQTVVQTPWLDVVVGPDDWAEAFASPEPGLSHNEAREQVWETLGEILSDRRGKVPASLFARAIAQDEDFVRTFEHAWPLLDPVALVAELWRSPTFLRRCAPWLTEAEVEALHRDDGAAWSREDLPLLDAARQRIGDPEEPVRRRRQAAALAAEREERARVVDHLIEADDSEMLVMTMLRGEDFQNALDDREGLAVAEPEAFAGPFAHIVVDEAQELTDAEWGMLLRRCPSRSFTIVGDRAQARHGFAESWEDRLARVGVSRVALATLTINYRTPEEVMAEAEPVIRAAIPDANVPLSVRASGLPVVHGTVAERDGVIDAWLAAHGEGVACVIGDGGFTGTDRVRSLTPETAKGLEFDLVVLVDPATWGDGIEGAVDRYVAMTRATQQLVVLGG